MQENKLAKDSIDSYLSALENLSSKIADSITMGEFNQVQKLDLERKNIIKKISNDAANLNTLNTRRLKLIWVNNKELVKKAEESISKKKEKFNKLKKTFKAYSKQ